MCDQSSKGTQLRRLLFGFFSVRNGEITTKKGVNFFLKKGLQDFQKFMTKKKGVNCMGFSRP